MSRYSLLSRELAHLQAAHSLLYWDLETQLPAGANAWRAETLGHFAGLVHEKTTALSYQAALEEALHSETDFVRREALSKGLEDLLKAQRIPQSLVEELARATATSQAAWAQAKEKRDFSLFSPHLKTVLKLTREKAACLAQGGNAYNALLDEFSPGMRSTEIDQLFTTLRPQLQKLLGKRKPPTGLNWEVPLDVQEKLSHAVAGWMGFPKENLVQARSVHPFCLGLHPSDVRITTRYRVDDPYMSLMSTVHELGHALYEHQLPQGDPGTPLMQANGMDLHESQSRLWEVCLASSPEFFRWVHRWFSDNAPEGLQGHSAKALFARWSEVSPSLIRTEADPVTYGMHIMIRYGLEKRLFQDDLKVDDLPGEWNQAYKDFLGVTPAHDGEGVLQDSHWSFGGFGYFPSYLLGTMIACQMHERLEQEFPALGNMVERGDMGGVRAWLKTHVHSFGRGRSTQAMLAEATGRTLESAPFLALLSRRFI